MAKKKAAVKVKAPSAPVVEDAVPTTQVPPVGDDGFTVKA